MKKCIVLLALVLMFVFTGCVSQEDYDVLAAENLDLDARLAVVESENAVLKAENEQLAEDYAGLQSDYEKLKEETAGLIDPESIGLQETKATYTRDFNTSTNQTITFGEIEFDIPESWSVVSSGGTSIYIRGKEESALGDMCVELLAEGVSERDLAQASLQWVIVDAYIELLTGTFDVIDVTNDSYNSSSQLYFCMLEGLVDGTYASCGICAFVEQGNLYAYVIPFIEGDMYCYDLDVQEIVETVSAS